MAIWTVNDVDSQEGKTVLITGASSGIGFETARYLAKKGALVILASDDPEKGQLALESIKRENPAAKVRFELLDLASLLSIHSCCDRMMQELSGIDVLINNAGVAGIPHRLETIDGHEMTFAVNYLGHFILTAELFPLLLKSSDPRIILVSSLEHRSGFLNFDDIESFNYNSSAVYAQSKLALLSFAFELNRRALARGLKLKIIPVHPGATATHIFDRGPELARQYYHPKALLQRTLIKLFGQNPRKGALSLIFAATSVEARSGVFYGPDGPGELWGNPTEAKVSLAALNAIAADHLWKMSEELSGVVFDLDHKAVIGLH
jgi:NAD(P)-dependent dehydrogenase (short-subunit alcohol dehydrogenase family)